MYIIGKISVSAVLPEKLARLKDMAYNLWWTWNHEAAELYREIDPELWERTGKNPVRLLQEVSQQKIDHMLNDRYFMNRYESVVYKFDSYLSETNTWFNTKYPDRKDHIIAYFSAEYGLNEVLPIYSGGLGVLSGDHCKSSSDLGIPFVGVGLFYKHGYFNQHINSDGWQETSYEDLNISHLPLTPVLDERGEQMLISVELPGRIVYARIWKVSIGRISLYLMDTDVEQNSPADRSITYRLYGGDQETRIQQEFLLGIGGIKMLDKLGIKPSVYHMNEGHSAFLGLELIRKLVQDKGLSFNAAKEAAFSSMIFTTHTPVPAGNDVFPVHMMDKYFSRYWEYLGISRDEFMQLGFKGNDNQNFNMTVLALKLAGRKNGVSQLHGAVTRRIFSSLYPGIPEDEIPVTHITNGIHTLTWLSPNFKELYDKYLDEDWTEYLYDNDKWSRIDDIPDNEIWEAHRALKIKMINHIRECLREQRALNGESFDSINETGDLLDPDILTIGFARRFATYKRANLIFRNIERIRSILNCPDMPVQLIFAGKAHPADRPAHEVIKSIHDITRQDGFKGKVILVENYNMTLARYLVQGVDVWLNNPRRPLEASGTSGQKVCINGVLNFSILDGWWCEGYNGRNGWAIGNDISYDNEYHQDNADSESMYNILEQQIIPLFYKRDNRRIPVDWIKMIKESVKSLAYRFSTHRMVKDYTEKMYLPSMDKYDAFSGNNYDNAGKLAEWKSYIYRMWPDVQIIADKSTNQLKEYRSVSGKKITITAAVNLGGIQPSDVKVQVYYGILGKDNKIGNASYVDMEITDRISDTAYIYSSDIELHDVGEYGYTIRVIPWHPYLCSMFDLGLLKWIEHKL